MAQSVEECLPRKFRVLGSIPIGRKREGERRGGEAPIPGWEASGKTGNLKADGGKQEHGTEEAASKKNRDKGTTAWGGGAQVICKP